MSTAAQVSFRVGGVFVLGFSATGAYHILVQHVLPRLFGHHGTPKSRETWRNKIFWILMFVAMITMILNFVLSFVIALFATERSISGFRRAAELILLGAPGVISTITYVP